MPRDARSRLQAIDQAVGGRLRDGRILRGLSQSELAVAVGLSFQQIQKYECGDNRISASRLYEFAYLLQVDIDYFFAAVDGGGEENTSTKARGELPMNREVLWLLRAFEAIGSPDLKRRILDLTRSLGKS